MPGSPRWKAGSNLQAMMSHRRSRVDLLVTDLDNTLYDWFAMWYASFSAMIESICAISGIPEDVLLPEIRIVHQKRGTSEYSYLLNELPSLRKLHPGKDVLKIYDEAIHKYRAERKNNLRLYPTVKESLLRIKSAGVPIIAYTESLAYYSSWRLRELDLDGVIDYLYSPPDHDFPEGVTVDSLRSQEPESYSLKRTKHRYTPRGALKPDTEVLEQILSEAGVPASRTAYVGDSLMKDVAMAQRIEALDVLAEYGEVKAEEQYNLLRRVSHWTESDVERERRINAQPDISATYTLPNRFDEIFKFFTFGDEQ